MLLAGLFSIAIGFAPWGINGAKLGLSLRSSGEARAQATKTQACPRIGRQLRLLVIRPTLRRLGLWSQAAENLLVGTALVESCGVYLKQIRGPALGIYQMEPQTHEHLWATVLHRRPGLRRRVIRTLVPGLPRLEQLAWNHAYATAMARVYLLAIQDPLPASGDIQALARYWKQHWNTPAGRGRVEEFVERYQSI